MDCLWQLDLLQQLHSGGRRLDKWQEGVAEMWWSWHRSEHKASQFLHKFTEALYDRPLLSLSVNDVQVGRANNYHRRFLFDITVSVINTLENFLFNAVFICMLGSCESWKQPHSSCIWSKSLYQVNFCFAVYHIITSGYEIASKLTQQIDLNLYSIVCQHCHWRHFTSLLTNVL